MHGAHHLVLSLSLPALLTLATASLSSMPDYFDLPEPGRVIKHLHVPRVVAWGHSDLECFATTNTMVYVYKGIAPIFNVYLIIYNANVPVADEPDIIIIDLQKTVFDRNYGPSILIIRSEDLSFGVCLRFANPALAEDFEMSIHAILIEAAAEHDGIPFEAVVHLLLDPAGVEYDQENGVFPALERLYQDVEDGLYD
ncbi:hypothetical protein LXA43DRAFT_1065405 [Ganoderma leucocontextum]|nr:hypothetical protein LXA43DRAFT_1065405 [Ganoderma leucocontextum]